MFPGNQTASNAKQRIKLCGCKNFESFMNPFSRVQVSLRKKWVKGCEELRINSSAISLLLLMVLNNVGIGEGEAGSYHRSWSTEAPDCALICSHKGV